MSELDGLDAILDFLAALDYPTAQSSIHSALLACLKALMNNSVGSATNSYFFEPFEYTIKSNIFALQTGRAHVLAHPTGINVIAQSLHCESTRSKVNLKNIINSN